MRTPRYVFAILVLMTALALRADTLKLKDGNVLEGEVTAEDDSSVSIYLEFSRGTITQTRRIDKADIAEIVRWTPEQKENWRLQRDYERLQTYRLNPKDSYLLEYYDHTIDGVFQKFLNDHPNSPYTSNVTARIADWMAERALVSANNIKFRGRWSPAAEVGPLLAPERGKKFLEQARWLISQRRFESAIPGLQVVVHMKDHPELVSQAKPLLTSAYQQMLAVLDRQSRQLSNDVAMASVRVNEARRALNNAEVSLTQAVKEPQVKPDQRTSTNLESRSASQPQTGVDDAQGELNAALDRFEQLEHQWMAVTQKMAMLKLQARDVGGRPVVLQESPTQTSPAVASSDNPSVLVALVAWAQKYWPGMAMVLLVIVFLISRFAKD